MQVKFAVIKTALNAGTMQGGRLTPLGREANSQLL